jgi:hypothetical protein
VEGVDGTATRARLWRTAKVRGGLCVADSDGISEPADANEMV